MSHAVIEMANTREIILCNRTHSLALLFMVTSFAGFSGERLRARFGSDAGGSNGQSSTDSEQSEAVEEFESAGEALCRSTPFLTTDALIQLLTSEDEFCLAPAKASPASKPSCLHAGLQDSFLFLVGEGGEETLHLLANRPRFCLQDKTMSRFSEVEHTIYNKVPRGRLKSYCRG